MFVVHPPIADPRTKNILKLAIIWHLTVALGAIVGIGLISATGGNLSVGFQWLVIAILLAYTIISTLAAWFIYRSQHRGRIFSLIANYLGFLCCLIAGLHVLGFFVGIDSLGDTFGRGIPYLGCILLGYLIGSLADRYENYPARQKYFRRAGQVIMAVFLVVFLFAVGIVPGFIAVIKRFNNPLSLIFTLGAIIFGIMIWALWRKDSAKALGANNLHEEMLNGYLFLSPNLLGFLLFFAGPLLLSFYFSFTNYDATTNIQDWIGMANYSKLFNLSFARLDFSNQPATEALNTAVYDELTRFTLFGQSFIIGAQDKLFWIALLNTIVFCILAVPLSVIPALLLANLLNSKLTGMKFFRAVYFLPSVAAVVGVALIWQWLYNAAVGYINFVITSGINLINLLFGAGLIDPQIRWLSDTHTALLAVVIMSAWQWIGFYTVLFLAGMQNISQELYEAATVDGAGKWSQFTKITIPLLAPTTFFVVTTAIISALQLFEQVYVLINTEPPGGPNNSTLSLVLYLYVKGFQRFQQGYASAVAWILFIVIFSVTLIQYRRQRGSSYG